MEGNFVLGVDLGQVADFSALAVVERLVKAKEQPFAGITISDHHHVRHLHRWPLGTPYRQVVADTGALMVRAGLQSAAVVIDGTGVGKEVSGLFMQAYRTGHLGRHWPRAFVITGGREVTDELVPKRELVGKMQTLLQSERLKISDALELAPVLRAELLAFSVKTSLTTGHESFEAARERDHDDIVLAVALASWFRHTFTDPIWIKTDEEVSPAASR